MNPPGGVFPVTLPDLLIPGLPDVGSPPERLPLPTFPQPVDELTPPPDVMPPVPPGIDQPFAPVTPLPTDGRVPGSPPQLPGQSVPEPGTGLLLLLGLGAAAWARERRKPTS